MNELNDKISELLKDFKGGVISAHNNNYGENVWNAEDFAQKQALEAIEALITEQVRVGKIDQIDRLFEWIDVNDAQGFAAGSVPELVLAKRLAQLKSTTKEDKSIGNDVDFEGLSGVYDNHIIKRLADLTE